MVIACHGRHKVARPIGDGTNCSTPRIEGLCIVRVCMHVCSRTRTHTVRVHTQQQVHTAVAIHTAAAIHSGGNTPAATQQRQHAAATQRRQHSGGNTVAATHGGNTRRHAMLGAVQDRARLKAERDRRQKTAWTFGEKFLHTVPSVKRKYMKYVISFLEEVAHHSTRHSTPQHSTAHGIAHHSTAHHTAQHSTAHHTA